VTIVNRSGRDLVRLIASHDSDFATSDIAGFVPGRCAMSAIGTRAKLKEGQSQFGFAPVVQTSTCSALARASSTSMARYLTVLSIFELGLATAKAFRGRRFAAAATAAWSRLPSLQSRLFYSTGRNNISSQRVAARLVLQLRGASCGSHNLRSRSSASGREWS